MSDTISSLVVHADHARQGPPHGPDGPVDRPWVSWTLVAVTVALLWTVATLMAREYRERRAARAEHAADVGHEDLTAARTDDAVARFREAVTLAPSRLDYRLRLAQALLSAGRAGEAETYLRDVLQQDAVHGLANLALGRLERARGRAADAESAYYRAIYGRWSPGEDAARLEARLELVELLRETGDRDRVRAELVQLASAFPGDRTLQVSVGRSLLELRFPDSAARLFQAVIDRFADPGPAYAGLAEAEFARGNYAAALQAARRAIDVDRADRASAARRDLALAVLALDPTRPRLSAAERVQRTSRLLALSRDRLEGCPTSPTTAADEQDFQRRLEQWTRLSPARRLQHSDEGAAILEESARRVIARCGSSSGDQALDLALRVLVGEPQS